MASYRRAMLGMLLAMVLLFAQSAFAQQGAGAEEVSAKLLELKDSPPSERAEKRKEVLALGAEAAGLLIQEVSRAATEKDKNYIAHCIVLLGELKEPGASEVLLKALEVNDKQVAYLAARALGSIWKDKGGVDERSKQINAALLSIFYQKAPGPEAFGPGIALVDINGIPLAPQDVVDAQKLLEGIDEWMDQAEQSLPPRQDQPWPLLLRTVVKGRTPAIRQEARNVLVARKPLDAVDSVLELLRREATEVSEGVWGSLGELLGDITGVPFPPGASEGNASSRQQLVELWKERWFETLRKRRSEQERRYCWSKLEEHVLRMYMTPSDETAREIQNYRRVLLAQLDGPGDIPEDASKGARQLLEKPLEVKEKIGKLLVAAKKASEPEQRMTELYDIKKAVAEDIGKEVGAEFLEEFTALARRETNSENLTLLADIMTRVSGIPCDLSQDTDVERNRAIDEWEQIWLEAQSSDVTEGGA